MYRNKANLVFGFHGCDAAVCEGLVSGKIELYPSAGFREKDHIQIAVINPNCIKAFFKVRMEDKGFTPV